MASEWQAIIGLEFVLLVLLIGVTAAVLIDPYISRRHRQIIVLFNVLVFSMLIQNWLDYQLQGRTGMGLVRTVVSVYGYSIRPVMLVLIIRIAEDKEPKKWRWWLVAFNAAVYLSAFFSHIGIWFDENAYFHRGPLGYTCHVISFFLLLLLLVQGIREARRRRISEMLLPLFCTALIVLATLVDTEMHNVYPVSFQSMAVVTSSVFYYIWLHLRFVREHEQALRAEQRIQIMISQIQPHFLFNTLSTIQALCRIDPELASDTLARFGTYLRQNIDSLSEAKLIPFEKELDHTRVYAEIEGIRFPFIEVEYEIEDDDFSLPALTLQPLVENAIRHGIRGQYDGRVSVHSFREEGEHVIVIRDNGRGFDTGDLSQKEPGHIGLRNVRDRVEELCGGTLQIKSRINEGTTVTIRIPATEEEA